MTDGEKLNELTQDFYLTLYNREIDDIEDTDGQAEVSKVVRWVNLFLNELEQETDSNGMPINWVYRRQNDVELGTISGASDTFALPSGALRPVADPDRPLYITQDSSIIGLWDVVDPNQLTSRNHYTDREQRVTYVNQLIVFSRTLNDTEIGGKVYSDLVYSFPRLASDDTTLLNLPIPRQLLILGAAKNSSLPDIVQGGLSPSYAQKYSDLLEGHKAANNQTGVASEAVTEDYSGIGGVY